MTADELAGYLALTAHQVRKMTRQRRIPALDLSATGARPVWRYDRAAVLTRLTGDTPANPHRSSRRAI